MTVELNTTSNAPLAVVTTVIGRTVLSIQTRACREGTRTLNLRIDSPTIAFVSPCEQRVNDGVKKGYKIDRRTTKD